MYVPATAAYTKLLDQGFPRGSESAATSSTALVWRLHHFLGSFAQDVISTWPAFLDTHLQLNQKGNLVKLQFYGVDPQTQATDLEAYYSHAELAAFLAVVILPWDLTLKTFDELYALGMPLFLPGRQMAASLALHTVTRSPERFYWYHLRERHWGGELAKRAASSCTQSLGEAGLAETGMPGRLFFNRKHFAIADFLDAWSLSDFATRPCVAAFDSMAELAAGLLDLVGHGSSAVSPSLATVRSCMRRYQEEAMAQAAKAVHRALKLLGVEFAKQQPSGDQGTIRDGSTTQEIHRSKHANLSAARVRVKPRSAGASKQSLLNASDGRWDHLREKKRFLVRAGAPTINKDAQDASVYTTYMSQGALDEDLLQMLLPAAEEGMSDFMKEKGPRCLKDLQPKTDPPRLWEECPYSVHFNRNHTYCEAFRHAHLGVGRRPLLVRTSQGLPKQIAPASRTLTAFVEALRASNAELLASLEERLVARGALTEEWAKRFCSNAFRDIAIQVHWGDPIPDGFVSKINSSAVWQNDTKALMHVDHPHGLAFLSLTLAGKRSVVMDFSDASSTFINWMDLQRGDAYTFISTEVPHAGIYTKSSFPQRSVAMQLRTLLRDDELTDSLYWGDGNEESHQKMYRLMMIAMADTLHAKSVRIPSAREVKEFLSKVP